MTDTNKLTAAFKELDYEDEAFGDLEKALQRKVSTGVTDGTIKFREAFPKDYIMPTHRNDVLEEVARQFDGMTSLGDTAASFAAYVRGMKR